MNVHDTATTSLGVSSPAHVSVEDAIREYMRDIIANNPGDFYANTTTEFDRFAESMRAFEKSSSLFATRMANAAAMAGAGQVTTIEEISNDLFYPIYHACEERSQALREDTWEANQRRIA